MSSLCEPPKVRVFLLDLKKYIIDLLTTKKNTEGEHFQAKKYIRPPLSCTASKPPTPV